jgi:VanZ family protein
LVPIWRRDDRVIPSWPLKRHKSTLGRKLCGQPNDIIIGVRAMRVAFKVGAWFLLLAIIVLSVVPPNYRPITPAPHVVEHWTIFFLTGLAFGLGYPRRHSAQSLALIAFSAGIELIQLAVPGRHARLGDFVVDALSVSIGVGAALLINVSLNRADLPPDH